MRKAGTKEKQRKKKKPSQFKVISTQVYSTQAFWKMYLALSVCSRLISSRGVPGLRARLLWRTDGGWWWWMVDGGWWWTVEKKVLRFCSIFFQMKLTNRGEFRITMYLEYIVISVFRFTLVYRAKMTNIESKFRLIFTKFDEGHSFFSTFLNIIHSR